MSMAEEGGARGPGRRGGGAGSAQEVESEAYTEDFEQVCALGSFPSACAFCAILVGWVCRGSLAVAPAGSHWL